MKPSLLSSRESSRFYLHWINGDSSRSARVDDLKKLSSSSLDFYQLLHTETGAGFVLPRAMRRLRNLLIALLIERDLAGKADLAEVVDTMSAFADFAVRTLLSSLHAEMVSMHGEPMGMQSKSPQQLIVLGMGKLGGGELNVSSDIDLIFAYAEDGETQAAAPDQRSLSNQEFFTRLGRRLIGALSEITEDGFVFRVDMALRPNGASGPLVASFGMIEQYLIVQGREWERYAWIKARAITGHADDIATLEDIVRPFIYRRYLDYGVIDAIRTMHQQIRAEVDRQERLHPERNNNVKLGRGGIREIEFLAQVFQLIRGGRDPALRDRSTRRTLRILEEKNLLSGDVSRQLLVSYTFLRNLEHRLQYLDDAQTHTLPPKDDDRLVIAKTMGFSDTAALLDEMQKHRQFVADQFDEIFSDKRHSPGQNSAADQQILAGMSDSDQREAMEARLISLGFMDPGQAAQRLISLWQSNRVQSLPEASRSRLMALINAGLPLIVKISRTHLVTLGRLLDFFEAIARRAAYLSLLTEYPYTQERVVRMLDSSGWAATYLTRHPILLDEMLDARTLMAPPDWPELARDLQLRLESARGDVEQQMDLLREIHHAYLFRLLAQDLEGILTVEQLADHLSALADVMVEATMRETWLAMPNRHRDDPRFAVIAYGKLGGKELGYASDLDVIFLYDDDHADAPMLYARLAQRFITWMTTPTPAGILFDVDIALRPDGASGLMVSSLSSFERYQNESAWVWEHQALTRARFCAGDKRIGERFEAIRENILRKKRDASTLKAEILAMRARMHEAHPNRSQLFDLKHDEGGMIDIEFIVQYLVLEYASQYPQLTGNIGNIALLRLCESLGLIEAGLGVSVSDAYRNFRRMQHKIRMQGEDRARVDFREVESQVAEVKRLWNTVFA